METPVYDFVQSYLKSRVSRLHMPGHKGRGPLGCEALDITEIQGADFLYEPEGILAASQKNAAALFGSRLSFYATEGSSQCIKAMLALALEKSRSRTILAARNVHKAFLHSAALLDFHVRWLWPEGDYQLLGCPVTEDGLRRALEACPQPPAAVYLTSPDYLGHLQPISALSRLCHSFGVPLLVDNAHGAYLHFLPAPCHPLDLGADMCCDSAHKTLPVLTGGAYLHLAAQEDPARVRRFMAMFGSTSPSYLILQSLDLCNAYLAGEGPSQFSQTALRCSRLKERLQSKGWLISLSEPLKVVVRASASGYTGVELAGLLRSQGVECEYSDPDYLVLMPSPQNTEEDYDRVLQAMLSLTPRKEILPPCFSLPLPKQLMSIREAMFAPWEEVPASQAVGRICADPCISCPPAVPIAVSGELITHETARLLSYYGFANVKVVK